MKDQAYKLTIFEIIEQEFQASNHKIFNKSIKFTLEIEKKVVEKQLAYIDFEVIDLKSRNEFDFSNCFIGNFSMKNYRKKHSLKENEPILLLNFKANSTIFYTSEDVLDFSNLIIENETLIDFSSSLFVAEKLDFSATVFKTKNVKFENAEIACQEVDFSNCVFGTEETIFSNCKFIPGESSPVPYTGLARECQSWRFF